MTQADSVLSTPRRTASKITTEANCGGRDLHHAEAFRNLEKLILDLFCMGEIAAEVATGLQTDQRLEMTHFAVYRLCEMIRDLRAKFQLDLDAGKAEA